MTREEILFPLASTTRRSDVDGLRGAAILLVMLFHAKVAGFAGGFVGVDVFFVVSGYVIAGSIVRGLESSDRPILEFYRRRVLRLLPALFLVIAAVSLSAPYLLPAKELDDLSESITYAGLFASNLYFWRHSGYWDLDATRPLLHTWSLSVEEQFYLIAPLLALAVHRTAHRRWVVWVAIGFLASFALAVFGTANHPVAAFFSLPTRAWELLLGVLVARIAPAIIVGRSFATVLAIAGLGLIAIPSILYSSATTFPGIAALPPCLGSALLVFVGGRADPTAISRMLSTRALSALGRASYALYLVHWPLLQLVPFVIMRTLSLTERLSVVLLSALLAAVLHTAVERPIQRTRMSRRLILPMGLLIALTIVSLGRLGSLVQPVVAPALARLRSPLERQQIRQSVREGPCLLVGPYFDLDRWRHDQCLLTADSGAEILLWGDSFAAHYASGLAAKDIRVDGSVYLYSAQGCPPFDGGMRPSCVEFNRNALDIIRLHHIGRIVLSANWSEYPFQEIQSVKQTIDRLRRLRVEVTVLGQSPAFFMSPALMLARRGQGDAKSAAIRIDVDARRINDALGAIAQHLGATFVDPMRTMCPADPCAVRVAGDDLFLDYGHFAPAGSRIAVRAYFPYLDRRWPA